MNSLHLSFFSAAVTLSSFTVQAQPARSSLCTVNQLFLSTDAENGSFNGMAHSGTLLIIRNVSPGPCSLFPISQISFTDKTGKDLGAKGILPGARFMHPGPVVLPFDLPAGAVATASLRWISSSVYDKNACIDPKKIRVNFGSATLTADVGVTLCGDATLGITFDQARFALGPFH